MHISSSTSSSSIAGTAAAAAFTALLVILNPIKLSKQQELSSSTEFNGGQHNNQPGHFEFELAPNMEPPALRRPPYPPSTQLCPGSDILGGFSLKDTLCGDLNQGRVPINPLGHNIGNQPYPFELIRNKTLQFLARALPILKLEYESIPKVARLLPSSSASQQQQQQQQDQQHRVLLNPTHVDSPFGHTQLHQLNQRLGISNVGVPYGLLRRKRRAVSSSSYRAQTLIASELSPNTSLVVSSSHTSPSLLSPLNHHGGRIRDLDTSASDASTLITKDGYRQFGVNPRIVPQRAQQTGSTSGNGKQQQQQVGANRSNPATLSSYSGADRVLATTSSSSASRTSNESAPSAYSSSQELSAIQSQSDEELSSSPSSSSAPSQQGRSNTESVPLNNGATTGASSSSAHHQQSGGGKQQSGVSKPLFSCADASNGFTAVICHTTAAILEPAEKTPTWLQFLKQLGSIYAHQLEAPPSLLSVFTALANPTHQFTDPTPERSAAAKSAGSSLTRQGIVSALLGPLSSLLTSSPSTPAKSTSHKVSSTTSQSLISSGGGSGSGQNREAVHSKTADSSANQMASPMATLGSSAMMKLALAGFASNAIAGLIDYFVPSVFQSLQGRSFARRKTTKPFDSQDSFVDTPASLAANIRQQQLTGKQPPPTPCPSVEEYISPTFARNYQGAWKYVVQIPHEGYFTQTIQRTSCVRSRCEFTDGVCHESPRWVSLLVAEIYYPNTVFTQPPPTNQQAAASEQQQQQLIAQASTNSIQHQRSSSALDPLQMTDSLGNSYNSALMNAANELSWDPATLQQLANSYNYQLMQRNGLPASTVAANNFYQPVAQSEARNPSNLAQADQLNSAGSDYIAALAAATLQQNPNINIQDLINSLSIPETRKKRDISAIQQQQQLLQQQQQQQQQRQRQYAQPQHRSAETIPSINDINSQLLNANQQQQQQLAANFVKQQSEQQVASAQTPSFGPNQNLAAPQIEVTSSSQQQQQPQQQQPQQQPQEQQANSECDGHDKLGCYVVRVYYDWFLVNGSCKCWKTSQSPSNQAQSATSSSSGNSFLRRIFTG